MRVTEFLIESIVGDLRNSIVRGLKPEFGPGNNAYEGILNGFDQTAKFAKDSFTKDAGGIDNSKVVWALQWYVLDTKMHYLDKRGVVGVEDGTELFTDKEKQRIMKIVDIGTGSGCIAITLAKLFPSINLMATDISKESLQLAKSNAEKHSVSEQLVFCENDLLANLQGPFDIVVSNL